MKRYAILVAGGKGVRMGSDIPKQFLCLSGKPILMHTIDAIRRAYSDIEIILVLPAPQQVYWQQLCQTHHFDTPVAIAHGGETRFHSVRNGLALVSNDEESLVGVHDGVRPFVSPDTIHRCYTTALQCGTAVPVVPVVETIRQLLPNDSSQTVDRSQYRLVQTPQVFQSSLLKRAYAQTFSPLFTDDASVVEAMGGHITLVEGNRENIKITSRADLTIGQALL